MDAINNIITEDVPDYEKLTEIVDDIVENKTEEYPDLKVVIMDSLDELIRITEAEIVRKERIKDNNIDSILKVKGGFGKGQDYCMDVILDKIFELKSVGVQTFLIAHGRCRNTDCIQSTYCRHFPTSVQCHQEQDGYCGGWIS